MATNYPMPKFYFKVDFGGTTMACAEVSGLDAEAQIIEYRDGFSPAFYPQKMSGLQKFSNLTFKKGVFKQDNNYFDWWNKVKLNVPERQTVTISLMDEENNPTMVWTANNAWPTKVSSPDMKSDANEVAVESIELAYENLVIENS